VKRALAAVFIASLAAGCGKKGPPLPPLVRLPVAPADVVADRRGDTVDLALTVPAANTDGTRPANISRVEVYALTAPVTISDTVVLKDGVRVASVQVKTPKDPNDVADVDDPASDVEAPQGPGVDQGSTAKLHETLTAQSKTPYHAPPAAAAKKATSETRPGPLVGPPLTAPTRLYLALAFNQRGHRGPVAKRVSVPLIDPPARAAAPKVTYTEKSLTLSWEAAAGATHASDTLLPSRSLITTPIKPAFNVYEVAAGGDVKLTSAPITAATFADAHLEWGKERCFAIRSVLLVDNMAIEGERSPSACVTPADTFAPAAPKRPTAIALTAAINILWDANDETDLAGYLVFRGTAPGGPMTKLTPEPIDRTNFTDEVPADFRAFYAIEAVDKAGNASEMSPASDEETAR
jgi:predicted small lipoprotein YifL